MNQDAKEVYLTNLRKFGFYDFDQQLIEGWDGFHHYGITPMRGETLFAKASVKSRDEIQPAIMEIFISNKNFRIDHLTIAGVNTRDLERQAMYFDWQLPNFDIDKHHIHGGVGQELTEDIKRFRARLEHLRDQGEESKRAAEQIMVKYWAFTSYGMHRTNHRYLEMLWQKYLPYKKFDFANKPVSIQDAFEMTWRQGIKNMAYDSYRSDRRKVIDLEIDDMIPGRSGRKRR